VHFYASGTTVTNTGQTKEDCWYTKQQALQTSDNEIFSELKRI